jgi:hypothetical protein
MVSEFNSSAMWGSFGRFGLFGSRRDGGAAWDVLAELAHHERAGLVAAATSWSRAMEAVHRPVHRSGAERSQMKKRGVRS